MDWGWQTFVALGVVAVAVAYLARKYFGQPRPSKRPDVPLANLRRKRPKRDG